MGRIIFSILSLVALAVVIVMNAGASTDFNLLGWQIESVPVTVIAIGSFVLGVLYSFLFYVANYLAKGRRERLAARRQKIKTQEQEIRSKDASLKKREKSVTALAESTAKAAAASPSGAPMIAAPQADEAGRDGKPGLLGGIFGRKADDSQPAKPSAERKKK